MVTLVELLQRVYEELVEIHTAQTSVTDSHDYVDVINRETEIQTPFFGFEWDINALSRGMGGNRRIVELQNSAGQLEQTVARDYELMLDISTIVDGDKPRQRSLYMQAIASHFSDFITSPDNLHGDVNRVREQQTIPSPSQQTGDVSAVTTFSIEYVTYNTDSLPIVEDINLDIDADGQNAYPEQY